MWQYACIRRVQFIVHHTCASIRQPFLYLQYLENKHASSLQEWINKEQYTLVIIRKKKESGWDISQILIIDIVFIYI